MYLYGNVCFLVKCILVYIISIFYFKENYKHNVGIISKPNWKKLCENSPLPVIDLN